DLVDGHVSVDGEDLVREILREARVWPRWVGIPNGDLRQPFVRRALLVDLSHPRTRRRHADGPGKEPEQIVERVGLQIDYEEMADRSGGRIGHRRVRRVRCLRRGRWLPAGDRRREDRDQEQCDRRCHPELYDLPAASARIAAAMSSLTFASARLCAAASASKL